MITYLRLSKEILMHLSLLKGKLEFFKRNSYLSLLRGIVTSLSLLRGIVTSLSLLRGILTGGFKGNSYFLKCFKSILS